VADRRHCDDVAQAGDAAGVGFAAIEGAAASGGGVEQGAAVDVVSSALCSPLLGSLRCPESAG
jgi:hypothetical protein